MLIPAIAVAGAAAACFAVSTSLQHHVASGVPARAGDLGGLLFHLARRPRWLLGALSSAMAFALHAVALHLGALVIVQPIVVSGIVFAVPIRDALDKRRSAARDLRWVSITAVGIALFIVVANPGDGADVARSTSAAWLVGAGAVVIAVTVTATRRIRTARRQGLVLSIATGVAFGIAAGLLKMTVLAYTHDPTSLLRYWPAWSLLAIGTAGFVLNQRSYQLAPLSMTMPFLNVVDVLVAIFFGWYVFDEKPAHDPTSLVTGLAALVLMYVGVRRLANRAPVTEPTPYSPLTTGSRTRCSLPQAPSAGLQRSPSNRSTCGRP